MAQFRITAEVARPGSQAGWRPMLFVFVAPLAMMDCAWPESAEPATGAAVQLEDHYPGRHTRFPHDVTGIADQVYATPPGFRPLTLDLYLPAKRSPALPGIVFVHGGGWRSGHSRQAGAFENWPVALASVAARGYVVASANYRLSSEARSPAAALDIKAAIAWLRANAGRYALDESKIGIWGASAGGQLAALAGTDCERQSDCIQAVAAWYGIFDFAPLVSGPPVATPPRQYLGCAEESCADEQVRLASPIRFIDSKDPPFLLVHGADDRTVPVTQSIAFHGALQAAGVRSELAVIEDVDHSFIGTTPAETRKASLRAFHTTIDFFDCTLRGKGCD
jgi:acetyl esterase/lipase